jgi:hypothetical protein
MALHLRPHENVLYPVPYMETEEHPFIITNQRLVQFRQSGRSELPTSQISAVHRSSSRPLIPIGVLLILLSLPTLATGGYLVFSVWGMTAAPISDLLKVVSSSTGDSDDAVAKVEEAPRELAPDGEAAADGGRFATEVLYTRSGGAALGGLGLLLVVGGLKLVRRRRYFVLCRGPGGVMRVRAESENQQTQVLMTVQAALG